MTVKQVYGERIFLSTNSNRTTEYASLKKNINCFLTLCTKIYFNRTKDFKTKTKTEKLLEENRCGFGVGKVFIDKTATAKG